MAKSTPDFSGIPLRGHPVGKIGTLFFADLESLGRLLSSKTCFDRGYLCKRCPRGGSRGGGTREKNTILLKWGG